MQGMQGNGQAAGTIEEEARGPICRPVSGRRSSPIGKLRFTRRKASESSMSERDYKHLKIWVLVMMILPIVYAGFKGPASYDAMAPGIGVVVWFLMAIWFGVVFLVLKG